MEKEIAKKLLEFQTRLNAPKDKFNKFGNYAYRSAEGILEACKSLQKEIGVIITLNDEIVLVGNNNYVKATATIIDAETGQSYSSSAYARESENKKGMDDAQITGATSSYARKYALNALLAIDDNKDPDTEEFAKVSNSKKQTAAPANNAVSQESMKILQDKANEAVRLVKKAKTAEDVKKIMDDYSEVKSFVVNVDGIDIVIRDYAMTIYKSLTEKKGSAK